ncbi:LuxR family transcriptional regulator [Streptomyces globosus]|uniref:LuxR family transcriptional regulator n=1 Tax=Streptomyces globosus TaxID=68209 RepID=A0A344TZY8_9ACTN|nr:MULTISPECIES: LuxR family transcriptional regulator [Streptomyces]AXE24209.1 LuxR family transcriptional regulator [Streptomyces globosus]
MLLERTSETVLVQDALHAAADGRSSLLLFTGPLGIGRSAWLRELPARFTGHDVCVMRANAAVMEQDFAYGVVRQLFDSLTLAAAAAADGFPPFGDTLSEDLLPAAAEDPAAPLDAVLSDLREMLARLGRERPLLILVDDLQWADTWSLRCLAYLAGRPQGLRAVLVCTLRDGDPRARHPLVCEVTDAATQVMRPAPLSPAATGQLIRERFGESGDEEFVLACHRASGGNPMFLSHVLAALADTGLRPSAAHAGTAGTLRPAPLRERLAGCLSTQTRPVRDLAAAIAILGEQDTPGLAARLARLDTIGESDALRTLHRLGLLRAEGVRAFVHPVVQDAAEASMAMDERGSWHERAATLLHEAGHSGEEVAAQLMAAATPGNSWSAAVLRTAADAALRRGAHQEAARFLRRALIGSPEQGEERARLLIDLAAAESAYDSAACERHTAQAIALLDTPHDRAAAALRISPGFLTPLNPAAADILRQAAAGLGSPERLTGSARDLALRLEARLSHCARQDPAELARSVRRLRERPEDPAVFSGAERELLAVLLHAAALSGRLPAYEVARQAGRILASVPAAEPGPPTVLPLLAPVFTSADDVDALAGWLADRERHRGRAGGGPEPFVQVEEAMVLLARGRLAHAREHAERAFEREGDGHPDGAAMAATVLAAIALEACDPVLGERVRAGTRGQLAAGNLACTTMLRLTEAQAEARRGDLDRALDTVLACGRQLEASGWRNPVLFPWRPWAIRLLHRSGDLESARALAEEEYAQARIWGAPVAIGRAQRLRGRLRGGSEGTALLRDAVNVLRGSANGLELARTLRALARAVREGAEARELQRESAALALACGVPWKAEQDVPRPPGPAGTPPEPALTPTESRVAALAGSGLTNQEIATELGVGSRVVEKHLTNSYRKLGISGRPQLAALLGGARKGAADS